MSILKTGTQFIKNLFINKLTASDLNNYRRSCNAHYDDVCMQGKIMLSTGLRSVLKQALTKPRLNKIKTSEVAETLPKPKVEEDLVFTPIKKVEETGDAASALAKEMGIDRDEILNEIMEQRFRERCV